MNNSIIQSGKLLCLPYTDVDVAHALQHSIYILATPGFQLLLNSSEAKLPIPSRDIAPLVRSQHKKKFFSLNKGVIRKSQKD